MAPAVARQGLSGGWVMPCGHQRVTTKRERGVILRRATRVPYSGDATHLIQVAWGRLCRRRRRRSSCLRCHLVVTAALATALQRQPSLRRIVAQLGWALRSVRFGRTARQPQQVSMADAQRLRQLARGLMCRRSEEGSRSGSLHAIEVCQCRRVSALHRNEESGGSRAHLLHPSLCLRRRRSDKISEL